MADCTLLSAAHKNMNFRYFMQFYCFLWNTSRWPYEEFWLFSLIEYGIICIYSNEWCAKFAHTTTDRPIDKALLENHR